MKNNRKWLPKELTKAPFPRPEVAIILQMLSKDQKENLINDGLLLLQVLIGAIAMGHVVGLILKRLNEISYAASMFVFGFLLSKFIKSLAMVAKLSYNAEGTSFLFGQLFQDYPLHLP